LKTITQVDHETAQLLQKAMALYQQGHLTDAKLIYESVLRKAPKNLDALNFLGVIALQFGDFQAAIKIINEAIDIMPNSAILFNNLGIAQKNLEYFDMAINSFNKAIQIKPDYAEAYSNRGNTLQNLQQLEEAVISYDKAIHINPDYAEALYNRGNVLQNLQQLEKAVISYDKAIHIKPNYAEALYNRGNALHNLQQLEQALNSYDEAIHIKPNYAEAFSNRGFTLQKLNKMASAIDSFDKAININPNYAEAHYNRGCVLQIIEKYDECVASFNKAISLNHEYCEAYYNLGLALLELKAFDAAITNFDKVISNNPKFLNAYIDKSLVLLLTGNLPAGFELYEWRRKINSKSTTFPVYPQSLWLGTESLKNKTILIWGEHDLRDTIQFCRYAELLNLLGAHVLLEVEKPLFKILASVKGVHQTFSMGDSLPKFDYQCPLMSLPLAFKTSLKTIPSQIPYIFPCEDGSKTWASQIGDNGFKIAFSLDLDDKSFPITLFEDIANINNVRLISLTNYEHLKHLGTLPIGLNIETLEDTFENESDPYLDSAAVLKRVDLFITTDTALAHLAGALGVRTWMPINYLPEWRWFLDRIDSPWYPNHRLFRQQVRGNWTSVFKEMAKELRTLVSNN